MKPISYYNRYTGALEVEKVYGGRLISWVYGSALGFELEHALLSRHWFSQIYGAYNSSYRSQKKINKFIRDFKIPMEEFEPGPFESFNDFFIRKFKDGQRPFSTGEKLLGAFAEGRYLGFSSIDENQKFPVKGVRLNLNDLLGSPDLAMRFMGGPILIARLCPVDYHRFHFPDDGVIEKFAPLPGRLHSVNPAALRAIRGVFFKNERHMSLLRTKNFGTMAYIEVGALGVGKIVQSHSAPILSVHPRKPKALEDLALKLFNIDFKKYLFLKRSKLRPKLSKNVPPSEPLPALTTDGAENNFKKGEEKGYFLFGGSTVIVCGEPGAWNISPDILKSTAKGFESYIKLGDTVAEPASGPR